MAFTPELAAWFRQEAADLAATLTAEEHAVLVLCSKGLPSKAVGAQLGYCISWVEARKRDAFAKLEVKTVVEAAVVMTKAGLV